MTDSAKPAWKWCPVCRAQGRGPIRYTGLERPGDHDCAFCALHCRHPVAGYPVRQDLEADAETEQEIRMAERTWGLR